MTRAEEIARHLQAVRARIARAESAGGRTAGSVKLLAVSKTKPPEDIRAAIACGQLDFGENYAQELRDKRASLETPGPAPRWHFIGPLQSNKVKYVAGKVTLIHAVDSAELLQEIDRRSAPALQLCLVQVNVAGEKQKRGVAPSALPALLDRFATLSHLRLPSLPAIGSAIEPD